MTDRPGPARRAAADPAPGGDAPAHAGLEAALTDDDHDALRLWLRLLACSTDIETEIRRRLRATHGMTLSRFDYLAQLHRHPQGIRMKELSRCLMVTGGSVTGLTDELEREGWVARESEAVDRRSTRLHLTPAGRRAFESVARTHEAWVVELFAPLPPADRRRLHQLLGRLRTSVAAGAGRTVPPPAEAAPDTPPPPGRRVPRSRRMPR